MHILLVEPDLSLARTYRAALEHHGHSVKRSSSAQEAVTAADKRCPDLVILELELATHNGIEFLYEFRSYPEWQSIPVMILSHVPPDTEATKLTTWRQLGVVAYHYKPATRLTDLIRAVAELPVVKV